MSKSIEAEKDYMRARSSEIFSTNQNGKDAPVNLSQVPKDDLTDPRFSCFIASQSKVLVAHNYTKYQRYMFVTDTCVSTDWTYEVSKI